MKVLIQNRIDGFTEVQLSALAAFQSEQADGGLSKNLRGKEKRQSKVLLGIVQLQLLGTTHVFGHFSLISTCFCVRSCFLSKCNSKEKMYIHQSSIQSWNILDLSVALPSEYSAPLTQARHMELLWDAEAPLFEFEKISFWSDLYYQGLDCFSQM